MEKKPKKELKRQPITFKLKNVKIVRLGDDLKKAYAVEQ